MTGAQKLRKNQHRLIKQSIWILIWFIFKQSILNLFISILCLIVLYIRSLTFEYLYFVHIHFCFFLQINICTLLCLFQITLTGQVHEFSHKVGFSNGKDCILFSNVMIVFPTNQLLHRTSQISLSCYSHIPSMVV